ncbi:hypothetical protein U9M48_006600 [Paspalum notatum var. saurae]|uniref:Uncharacterized protein n=1 Tax=Paspalum notatum var. saurae TaxID=547442 RepID=A0AAQ3SKQ3_PASNO
MRPPSLLNSSSPPAPRPSPSPPRSSPSRLALRPRPSPPCPRPLPPAPAPRPHPSPPCLSPRQSAPHRAPAPRRHARRLHLDIPVPLSVSVGEPRPRLAAGRTALLAACQGRAPALLRAGLQGTGSSLVVPWSRGGRWCWCWCCSPASVLCRRGGCLRYAC